MADWAVKKLSWKGDLDEKFIELMRRISTGQVKLYKTELAQTSGSPSVLTIEYITLPRSGGVVHTKTKRPLKARIELLRKQIADEQARLKEMEWEQHCINTLHAGGND